MGEGDEGLCADDFDGAGAFGLEAFVDEGGELGFGEEAGETGHDVGVEGDVDFVEGFVERALVLSFPEAVLRRIPYNYCLEAQNEALPRVTA